MRLEDLRKAALIGAGTMGAGIAVCFAQAGYDVMLQDISEEQLDKALHRIAESQGILIQESVISAEEAAKARERITTASSLEKALDGVQFVLEVVPEVLDLKLKVFGQIESLCSKDVILATNTSGLSVTSIASACQYPERVVGFHWVNPPELVPLVEVIRGKHTDIETAHLASDLARRLGKMPIMIQKEVPGFAMNRLQFAALREALHLVEEGVVSPEDVDKAMSYGLGFRYPWLGPMKTADLGGLDVFHSVASYLFEDLSSMKEPPEFFSRLINEGKLGIKTERGFYDYENESTEEILRKRDLFFVRQWKLIQEVQGT